MKYRFLFLCCAFTLCTSAIAQQYSKIVVNARDTASGYYLSLTPPSNSIKAVLVLLDGFGGSPESIFLESKLPAVAFANDVLAIGAAMGNKLYADSAVIKKMNLLLSDVIKRYGVAKDKFVIGGFSAGGTISLRYTELCKQFPSSYPVNPKAVFTVDSPVDIISMWDYFQKQISKNASPIAVGEANFVSAIMNQEHGTPSSNLETYLWLTPFYVSQKGEGNEKFLKDIPVRVYHDVDVAWRLKNRGQSAYEHNFLNSSEMILRLLMLKNEAAEFVSGKTGYRNNGMRHPHSWNIVDEVELIQWMKKIVEK